MIKTAVCGLGRAGTEVIKTILKQKGFKVVACFCNVDSPKKGRDVGSIINSKNIGVHAVEYTDCENVFDTTPIDVVIDFSNPVATKKILKCCKKHKIPAVICTTGFTDKDMEWLKHMVSDNSFGLVYAPNVTLGVNVMISVLKNITHTMPELDYQITETHHSQKLDKPSGTAKVIQQEIKRLLPEQSKPVPINSVRAGGYVGVHEVLAVGENERITIIHESFSRRAFADGALNAARYVLGRVGWHEMKDVVKINAS